MPLGFVGDGSSPTPLYRRMMVFIDGENLVFNYQSRLVSGCIPKDGIQNKKDTFVWHPLTINGDRHEIIRAIYYTFTVGNGEIINEVSNKTKELTFNQDRQSSLPIHLRPAVFKKDKQGKKTKGVDIQITVDILTNLFNDNLDTVLLITGDGDFLPIINEIIRRGKQFYFASFKSGLNKKLLNYVNKYIELDEIYFQ
jgi:uncharacterized LabA/DUF88 family protein